MLKGDVLISKKRFLGMILAFLLIAGATAYSIAQEHHNSQASRRNLAGAIYTISVQQCYQGNENRQDTNARSSELNKVIANTNTLFRIVEHTPGIPPTLIPRLQEAIAQNIKAEKTSGTLAPRDCVAIYAPIRPHNWPVPRDNSSSQAG